MTTGRYASIVASAPPPNFANRTMWTRLNSNKKYEAPLGSKAAGAAFKDSWTLSDIDVAWHGEIADREPKVYAAIDNAGIVHSKSMKSYLIMMAVRLLELRRVLKPTGALYLHCDAKAYAYLRTLLDAVFGWNRFRNLAPSEGEASFQPGSNSRTESCREAGASFSATGLAVLAPQNRAGAPGLLREPIIQRADHRARVAPQPAAATALRRALSTWQMAHGGSLTSGNRLDSEVGTGCQSAAALSGHRESGSGLGSSGGTIGSARASGYSTGRV